MVDKRKYLYQLMALYEEKTGEVLSEEYALEYFEKLTALVAAIYDW